MNRSADVCNNVPGSIILCVCTWDKIFVTLICWCSNTGRFTEKNSTLRHTYYTKHKLQRWPSLFEKVQPPNEDLKRGEWKLKFNHMMFGAV